MSKLTVARALTARMGRRAIRLFTIIGFCVVAGLALITTALVYFFSPWWWLLLIPVLILAGIFLVVRFIALFILRRVHGGPLNARQREALDHFIDTVQELIEARATPPWVFAAITIKDIILHRDITTIKKLIADSAGLRRNYSELEKLF